MISLSVVKQSYTQEFWEIVDMPEGVGIYDIDFSQDNQLYAAVTGNDGAIVLFFKVTSLQNIESSHL
ncbi:MAG TPA: hypothetical protein PLS41_10880 [Bacteroidales bacterium]|nr:hypothetical protein [Bacteroidales bacterium]